MYTLAETAIEMLGLLAAAGTEPGQSGDGWLSSKWKLITDFISNNIGSLWFQITAGIIGLIIVIEAIRFTLKLLGGEHADKKSWFGKRRVRRDADKALRKKDYLKAGDLYLQLKDVDKAAAAYRSGRLWLAAGEALLKHGRWREAGESFERAELWERAAAIYEDAGAFDRAIHCMEQTQNRHGLVQILERAREFSKAAEIHLELGNREQAARCYDRAHEPGRAAEILHSVFQNEYVGKARSKAKVSEMAIKVGEMFLRAKRPEDAAHIFTLGEEFSKAAEIYAEIGDYTSAGESYEASGELEKAAEMYDHLEEGSRGAILRAEMEKDAGRPEKAAELYEMASKWKEAGELFFESRNFQKAAEAFLRASDFARAGEAFAMAGNYRSAAMAYEQDENWKLAADCYRKAGDTLRAAAALASGKMHYQAGIIYYENEDIDKTIENLQNVKENDKNYTHAAILLAHCFISKEMFNLARGKLESIISKGDPVNSENIDAFYLLARVEEEEGNIKTARDLLEKVLAIDFTFKDAADRASELKKKTSSFIGIRDEALAHEDEPADPSKLAMIDPGGGVSFHPPRYEMIGEIGRGGMGLVYKLHDTVLDRDVAFKTLGAGLRDNPKALDNFLREAKAAAALNHPNIVTIFDIGQYRGTHYMTMECVDGKTIKEILRAGKTIPMSHFYAITRQICEALEYAHSHKIVHRDIKTANIMVTTSLKVKILDFGLARVIEEMTMDASKVVGTPSYMSPEQILGKNVDHRTDIYSLGVSLYEAVMHELPFKGGNVGYHHLNTPPQDPRMINPEVPNDIARVIMKCLQKDMEKRYQHAQDILADLTGG